MWLIGRGSINLSSPRPAKTVPFVTLLCLTPDDFTHQWRASGWERVKQFLNTRKWSVVRYKHRLFYTSSASVQTLSLFIQGVSCGCAMWKTVYNCIRPIMRHPLPILTFNNFFCLETILIWFYALKINIILCAIFFFTTQTFCKLRHFWAPDGNQIHNRSGSIWPLSRTQTK